MKKNIKEIVKMANPNGRKKGHVISVLVIIAIAVVLLIALYSCSIHRFFMRQAYSYVQQNAQSARNQIDSKISHGIANIKLSSFVISKTAEEKQFLIDDEKSVLDSFLDKTPFSFLQYVSPDGRRNKNETSEAGRKYYLEAVEGKTGVFADFNSKIAGSVLLDFYSPVNLYREEKGILVGGMDVEKLIKPLISSDFYGKKTVGVLYDSNFRVIASSYPTVLPGSNLNDLKNCPAVDLLVKYVKNGDESGFRFNYKGNEHFGCVVKLKNADWFVVQILPKEATSELNAKSVFFIIFIILVFCILIFIYVIQGLKGRSSTERMHVNIITALCKSYHNVYVVNINSGKVFIYQLTERIRANYGDRFAAGNYDEDFKLYEDNEVLKDDRPLFEEVDKIEKIRGLLEKQNEYSFVYRVKSKTTCGKVHFYQCYFIRPEHSNEFVVTFKNVDDLIETKEKINSLMKAQTTQLQIMSSISGIYLTLYFIDLEKDSIVEFNTTKEMKKYIFRNDHAGEQIKNAISALCCKDFVKAGLEFSDLTTLRSRLKDKKYMSVELNSISSGWIRSSFITVDSDENGFPNKVLFATQEINNEKRREEILISNANTDELTKLLNRHAYEDEIRGLESDERAEKLNDDFVYISLDLNGLKNANDTLGHMAGDELLRGAAFCIKNAFGDYGKIFRTGGDEFQVIMFTGAAQLERAEKDFENDCDNWSGKLCKSLSVSYGVVTKKENPKRSVAAIIKLADKRMYRAKTEYYSNKGVDRRGMRDVMEILCKAYTKILKVDLTHDIFSVIQVEEDERDSIKQFDGIASKWISAFGNSDSIEENDRAEFLQKTDFAYLRNFFKNEGNIVFIHYGRKITGKYQKAQLEIIKSSEYTPKNEVVYFFVRKAEYNK